MNAATAGIYRSSATRARVASVLLGVVGIATGLRLAVAVVGLVIFQQSSERMVSLATFETVAGIWSGAGLAYVIATAGCAIGFLAWLSRAVDNAPALGGGEPAVSPRWAIAWWFIPFGNLGMPYEVVRDLHRRMGADPGRGHHPLLVAWWFAFISGEAVDAAATQLPADTILSATRYLAVEVVACLLLAGAAVLAVLVVKRIERMAQERMPLPSGSVPGEGTAGASSPLGSPPAEGAEPALKRNWRMRPSWVSFVSLTGAVIISAVTVAVASSGIFAGETAPHEDPSLEATLPHSVMGRPLLAWSVRGRHLFADVLGMDQAELDQMSSDLASVHLSIDDVSEALAGRSAPEDPAYLVIAYQFRGLDANELGTFGIDHPDAGGWSTVTLGGKEVQKGVLGMYDQTTHARGLPYVYDRGDVRYVVITDDDRWASDALRQLP